MSISFVTSILKGATKNVTGIVIPGDVIAGLGAGKRPKVKVTLNGYTYRSTVGTMGGKFMVGLSAENRAAAGVSGGEVMEIRLALDTEPRTVEIPDDLRRALSGADALEAFGKAAPSRKKEFVRQVEEAKAADTRNRRIAKIVDQFVR
jgi:hypothetical protein